jgi:hypothetical protein
MKNTSVSVNKEEEVIVRAIFTMLHILVKFRTNSINSSTEKETS